VIEHCPRACVRHSSSIVTHFYLLFKGGEGLFLAVLKGTGTVYIQTLPFSRLADRIIQSAPSAGGRRVGEGSALTGRFGGKQRGFLISRMCRQKVIVL
jgi:hypothetical protein